MDVAPPCPSVTAVATRRQGQVLGQAPQLRQPQPQRQGQVLGQACKRQQQGQPGQAPSWQLQNQQQQIPVTP